ncbi:MAG: DNA polymerase III subunit alpha [Clostridia bacterium]|nr:DNA polymerase III subunit alpha [Clostridia bacterium]
MKDFVHLHLHTEYSLLDGATKIDKVFELAKEMGQSAVAITDHGNMYGVVYFAEAAFKAGLKAIIGCELYMCNDMTKKDARNGEYEHLVLLCKDDVGYKNLIKLVSTAYIDGFYRKPRCDYKTLFENSEGLICLSACLAGRVPQLLLADRYEDAKAHVLEMKSVFGDDYYLEIQNHFIEDQLRINPLLIKLSRETGVKLVATNDVHYLTKEDALMQEVMMCINTQTTLDDPKHMRFETTEFYLKTREQMEELFPNMPEVLDVTVEIANKCSGNCIKLNKKGVPERDASLVPGYTPPNGMTAYEYLKMLGEEGMKKKYKEITPEIRERFDYELNTIADMGYLEYYLIVWDYINYAREHGIPVGAGRGSGVSSIIAYSIGITDVEPLQYSLIFERFLNKERVSMPDFDVDFDPEGREEVIEYVRDKYGRDKVAQIVTFGTLASRAAVKDVARVLRVSYAEVDRITKLMDGKHTIPELLGLKKHKKDGDVTVRELKELYQSDPTIKNVIDMAMKLEGMPRHIGEHAAGVIICNKPLMENIPLARNGEDIVTQFNMKVDEQMGMLKMDFLALKTLTDIKKTILYIKENKGVDIDFAEIGYSDKNAYDLIGSGDTDAVFQLESPGMKKFMRELHPENLEDVIAGISLFRPGPMDSIPKYIKFKTNPATMEFKHESLKPILTVTYGTIIYQEQVMDIVRSLAGFTFGQADIMRRAMGKKDMDEMARMKTIFIYGEKNEDGSVKTPGAVLNGVPADVAEDIFDEMAGFAQYAFNKSHAAAYAVLAYQTAYLKAYYPHEFLAAVLNDRYDKIDEVTKYVIYLKERGIPVLQPDINNSKAIFTVENNSVRFGLVGIKGVGLAAIETIVKEREENGPFKSFEDFISRADIKVLNKRLIENLIYAGAFDCFKKTRSQLIQVYDSLLERASTIAKERESNQMSLFGGVLASYNALSVTYPNILEYDDKAKLSKEREVLGVYVTGHPLTKYMGAFKRFSFKTELLQYYEEDEEGNRTYTEIQDGQRVEMGGIITSVARKTTKSGSSMATITLEDVYGGIECVFFSKSYEKYKSVLRPEAIVSVSGRLQVRAGQKPSISVDKYEEMELDDLPAQQNAPTGVVDKVAETQEKREWLGIIIPEENGEHCKAEVLETINLYPGDMPVVIKYLGKQYKAGSVRKCNGLLAELKYTVGENNVKFIEK